MPDVAKPLTTPPSLPRSETSRLIPHRAPNETPGVCPGRPSLSRQTETGLRRPPNRPSTPITAATTRLPPYTTQPRGVNHEADRVRHCRTNWLPEQDSAVEARDAVAGGDNESCSGSQTKKAQLSAGPFSIGSPSKTRTCDPLINSQLLYQLSYRGSPGLVPARRFTARGPRTVTIIGQRSSQTPARTPTPPSPLGFVVSGRFGA